YDRLVASDLKIRLMDIYPDEHEIVVIRGAGIPEIEMIERIPLYRLDNLEWLDHLTSVYLPKVSMGTYYDLAELVAVMKQLLSPEGCPWDRKQDHHSLKKYLLEETEEIIGAIDSGDMDNLCEELGDVLLQIVFHAELAAAAGYFNIDDVVKGITTKMMRRHPHVFGAISADNVETVLRNWEEIKQREKPQNTSRSALRKAQNIQESARTLGFDWPNVYGPAGKVFEEMGELIVALGNANGKEVQSEFGDVLFALVNLGRFLDVDPEIALDHTVDRFQERFLSMEAQAAQSGKSLSDMSLAEMDILWEKAKENEK
ncbi:MAG: nucleoside triphosphate pyrophosphohydrolase, partial [Limnochordia bacterium]